MSAKKSGENWLKKILVTSPKNYSPTPNYKIILFTIRWNKSKDGKYRQPFFNIRREIFDWGKIVSQVTLLARQTTIPRKVFTLRYSCDFYPIPVSLFSHSVFGVLLFSKMAVDEECMWSACWRTIFIDDTSSSWQLPACWLILDLDPIKHRINK